MVKNWRCVLPLFLVLLAGCTSRRTQDMPPTPQPSIVATDSATTWTRTFAGPGYGAFFDVVVTPGRDILAVGATNHLHVPPYSGDALFTRLTLDGDLLWEETWGGEGYEQAVSVVLGREGGFYVFGETDSYGAGDRDFFLLRLTQDGTEVWFRTYGRVHREWPYGMLRLSNDDLLLFGFTEPLVGSGRSQYAVRVNPNGDIVWEYVGEAVGEELVLDALETCLLYTSPSPRD